MPLSQRITHFNRRVTNLRGTSRDEWLGIPPGGGTFVVPFTNVVPFSQGLIPASGSTSISHAV